jgi:hypothetical protein
MRQQVDLSPTERISRGTRRVVDDLTAGLRATTGPGPTSAGGGPNDPRARGIAGSTF